MFILPNIYIQILQGFVFVSEQTENKIYVFSKTNGQKLSDAYSPGGLNVSSIAIYTDENQYINNGMSKVAHTYQGANVHIIIYHALTTDWLDSLKTFDIWKCINLSRITYLITIHLYRII